MRNVFHRNNSCNSAAEQNNGQKNDRNELERGYRSMAGKMVPGFLRKRFAKPKEPEAPESAIKAGSIRQLLSRYSIRRVKKGDEFECVPAETELFGRFYPSLPRFGRLSRPSISQSDVQGLFSRLWSAVKNLFSNLKELFTIPPHVLQALREFLKSLPLALLILFLIFTMNIVPLVVIASYKSDNCVMGVICWESISDLDIIELVNAESFVMVCLWYCIQLVLAGAPVGALARYENNETGEHVCVRHNAVFALYISLSLIFLLFLLPYTSLLTVYDYFMSLCVASLVITFLLALILHLNSFKTEHLSGDAKVGFEIFNFFVGKATHPLIRGIDMKRFLSLRPGLIGLVCSDWLLLLHHLESGRQLNCSFITLSILHFCYVLQAMNLEIDFLVTFRYTRDGFGYMHAWYSLVFIPFCYGLQSHYLYDLTMTESYIMTNIPAISVGSLLFFTGHYLLYVSVKQKTIFRRMTYHPKVYYLDHCKLNNNNNTNRSNCSSICSGFWGRCRHPNLLGEMFISFSFSVVCGFGNVSVHVAFLLQTIFLLCRSVRKEYAYKKEYGNCYKFYSTKTGAFISKFR